MDLYMIVFRIIHILAGAFWFGSAILLFLVIQPSARELGPAGGPFMGHLMQRKKLPLVILGSAVVTILAGLLLYWRTSGGFDPDWITSGPGLAFTLGALAAITAFVLGLVVVKPAADRMGALTAQVQGGGGPPSGPQAAELQRLQARMGLVGRIILVLLTLAVVGMAIARYL